MTIEIDADHGVYVQLPKPIRPLELVEASGAVAAAVADRHDPGDRWAQATPAPGRALPTAR
jgi:hypothetical protein